MYNENRKIYLECKYDAHESHSRCVPWGDAQFHPIGPGRAERCDRINDQIYITIYIVWMI